MRVSRNVPSWIAGTRGPVASWERESSLPEGSSVEGGLEAQDVDALIEDTERQFEEAQQRLEEQFQALESERPTNNDSEAQEAESSSDDTLDTSS